MYHLSFLFKSYPVVGSASSYTLRNDDCVALIVVLGFLCLSWVLSHSWSHIANSFENYLQPAVRSNRFVQHNENELGRITSYLALSSLMMGLWQTAYLSHTQPQWYALQSSLLVLTATVGGALAYYSLHLLLYAMVNSVFFTSKQISEWTRTYILTVLVEGVMIFPVALCAIYGNLTFAWLQVAFFLIMGFTQILRLIKLKSIFFSGAVGYVHIFLYFCTLNVAPTFLAWQILLQINHSVIL